MAHLIDGKKIAADTREDIKARVAEFIKQYGVKPGLAVIIVGENPASKVYVRNKKKGCEDCGMYSVVVEMPEETTKDELMAKIDEIVHDEKIHGLLVQLPLPRHLDEEAVIAAIPPEMDVDAFHAQNAGHIMIGDFAFLPCTPAGVMKMLEYEKIDITGKQCVVVGRSNIVGKPMAMLLLHKNGTVTICHSRTMDLAAECRKADILVVAIGKPKFITGDMIKPGAVVIDVGMDRDENGKLCGDVDFDSCEKIAGAITPVPGGVGPMTITMLLENTLTAAKKAVKAI